MNYDIIYHDIYKAFDRVDDGIVTYYIKEIRIDGKMGGWLIELLKTRTQTVPANDILSEGYLY